MIIFTPGPPLSASLLPPVLLGNATNPNLTILALELPDLLPTFDDLLLQYLDLLALLVVLIVDALLAFLVDQVLLLELF